MKRFTLKPAVRAVAETLHAGLSNYVKSLQDKFAALPRRASRQLGVAHVGISTYTGNIYSISLTIPATYDAAGYTASPLGFAVIGELSDFPGYDAKAAVGKFTPINGAIEKFKGVNDYGSGNIVCGDVPLDAGQVILKTLAASPNLHGSIKVLCPDGEKHYLDVIVAGWEIAPAKENVPKTRTAPIEVCRAVVVVAA
jgi:hypothetical protein